MTPEQIQQARREAQSAEWDAFVSPRTQRLARVVLALTEQQPKPVDETDLITFVYDAALANLLDIDGDTPSVLATELLSRYTITRKQPEGADHE